MLRKNLIAIAVCSAANFMAAPIQAEGTGNLPGGTDCSTAGINSSGTVIGECISSSTTGEESVAIYLLKGQSSPTPLPVLATGKICTTEAIGDDGTIGGDCDDADDTDQAVIWAPDASGNYTTTPTVLLPFQGVGNTPADDSAVAGNINAQGVVIGTSTNSEGHVQAVLWASGTSTPVQLLNPTVAADASVEGCQPLAINNATSPVVDGFCSIEENGKTRNQAIRWASSGGSYTATVLDDLAGHDCAAVDNNIDGDAIGTCADADGDLRAVYWAGNGIALVRLDTLQGQGISIDDAGNVVIDKLTADGYSHVLTGSPTNLPLTDVGVPPGGFNCAAVGENENGDIAVNCDAQPGVPEAYLEHSGKLVEVENASTSVITLIAKYASDVEISGDDYTASGHPSGFYYETSDGDVKLSAENASLKAMLLRQKSNAQSTAPITIKRPYTGSGGQGGAAGYNGIGFSTLGSTTLEIKGFYLLSDDYRSIAFYVNRGQCTWTSSNTKGLITRNYLCTR